MAGNGHVQYSSASIWDGGKVSGAVKTSGRLGARKAGEQLKAYSVPLAPMDLGDLRGAASVKLVNAEPVAYLVFDTEYAAIQHEEMGYAHDDGQAQYVAEPLEEHKAELMGIIAKEVRHGIANA